MATIFFFSEDLQFKLRNSREITNWIKRVTRLEGASFIALNYIFCSDGYLQKLNAAYLGHKSLTDVITFDYSIHPGVVNGEIYISIDRVRENSAIFKTEFEDELSRVMIHGVLHLIGYKDKQRKEKAVMREKEEAYLSLRK